MQCGSGDEIAGSPYLMESTPSSSDKKTLKSVLSIPRKKPPKLDDGRSNNCLEAMRSSSPPRKKILKEVNIDVSSDDANVAYLSWMIEIFLDYDGTLSPIVDDPDRAFMSNEVYELVGLPELYYAGSHGMDIMLPVENTLATNDANCIKATDQQGKEVNLFQLARKFLSMIDEVFRTLVKKTKDIKNWSAFGEYVVDVLKGYPRLRLTHGRKVEPHLVSFESGGFIRVARSSKASFGDKLRGDLMSFLSYMLSIIFFMTEAENGKKSHYVFVSVGIWIRDLKILNNFINY
ncbi:hypothetical protein P3S68_026084 [Capsicum galapagoense]